MMVTIYGDDERHHATEHEAAELITKPVWEQTTELGRGQPNFGCRGIGKLGWKCDIRDLPRRRSRCVGSRSPHIATRNRGKAPERAKLVSPTARRRSTG